MPPLLHPVGTAMQPGPVLYRDPLGVISPDGRWLAYTEGLHVRARRLAGGPVCELGPAERFVSHLAWLPDGLQIASFGRDPRTGELGWRLHAPGRSAAPRLWPQQPQLPHVRQLAFASDGTALGVAPAADGDSDLVRLDAQGQVIGCRRVRGRWSHPAIAANTDASAGLVRVDGVPRLGLPCGEEPAADAPEAHGPLAFSPQGDVLYLAIRGERGTLDLHARSGGGFRRLTRFARDAWAPSVSRDGRVLVKVQDYAVCVARVDAEGGEGELLTAFQSETPTWHPDGRQIAVTYGDWRRAIDDDRYPDIAQSLGAVSLDGALPASAPTYTVFASYSEDQGMVWSPDGRWIALHTHAGPSDDIWILPADRRSAPERVSGGCSETGWPRWSHDGRWLVYTAEIRPDGLTRDADTSERALARRAILCTGIDPRSGSIREAQREIALGDHRGRPFHAEWAPDGARIFFESADGGGRRSLCAVPASGGAVRVIHEFTSEQGMSGIAASPDGRWLAYVAPAPCGHYQIFRVPTAGGPAEQLTVDPSHKTQPCYSPDARSLAFAVWRYEVTFWLLDPGADRAVSV